ncbi:UDP-glucuronosyltransferase 2B15-like [Anastrepha ludens]|uniref:UDP-glucuronosyltransferase 2B15-like n=1 Tax=Anastrepha ludens TaxID=28586 RepID=UPI0023B1E1E9|nr:UDP-glucuronosyltransferase 2B15-like [Anastrepha ludens]
MGDPSKLIVIALMALIAIASCIEQTLLHLYFYFKYLILVDTYKNFIKWKFQFNTNFFFPSATIFQELEKFLNASNKNGAILFSLGSNMKSSNIQPATIQILYKVLSSLEQNVIWKWEDLAKTPGNASNIFYQKWLPQDDILPHPNLKLFITHAGKGGMVEATYHGVPMVAIPIFADQPLNAAKIVSSGYGTQVDIMNLKEDDFKAAILEVLNNPVYRYNVRKFAKLYRDRPLSARESVVYWVEYVLRHHGAAHMQSPLVRMNFIQSSGLDVLFAYFAILYALWRLAKLALAHLCELIRKVRGIFKSKREKSKKQ